MRNPQFKSNPAARISADQELTAIPFEDSD